MHESATDRTESWNLFLKEVSDKIQRTNDSSEKMPSSGTDESSGSQKKMETKNVCNGRMPLEDASQQTPVTSTTPTTIPTVNLSALVDILWIDACNLL